MLSHPTLKSRRSQEETLINTVKYDLNSGGKMNEQIKELIAIGASVSSHCQLCLSFHVNKAKECGVNETDVREAIEIGQMVDVGSKSAMAKYIIQLMGKTQLQSENCCSTGESKDECFK